MRGANWFQEDVLEALRVTEERKRKQLSVPHTLYGRQNRGMNYHCT
jgi:hypothetical protein